MDQETALTLQRIGLELSQLREERTENKRLLASINDRLGVLNDMVIRHEKDLRAHSGNYDAISPLVAAHETFISDEKGRRTVWHWVRGAIASLLLVMLGAALNTMRNFYIQQGSIASDIQEFSRRLTNLENRVFGTLNQETK